MAREIEFMPGYSMHAKQRRFIKARSTHKHRRFVGGRQSGKTDIAIAEAVLHATIIRPGGTGAIIGPDFPRAQEARDRFNAYCPYELRRWNGADRRWTVKANGGLESTVHWISLSNPDAARSKVLDWGCLDECAMYSEEAMNNLRPCFAVKEAPTWGSTTPKGMNWLEKETKEDDVFFVHCESIENPVFPQTEWDKAIKRHGFDSPFFKQEYRGLFQAFIGQAIPQFDRNKHVGSYPHNPDWPVFSGWDFGFRAPTIRAWLQRNPGNDRVRLIGCRAWTETERRQILLPKNMKLNGIPADAAVWHAIDPSGASPRAGEAGDRGWRFAMEERDWDVRWTRMVSETRRLNLMRELVQQDLLVIDKDCEGAELMIEAFELAELDDNLERDRLKDNQHPMADILDAVGYAVVEMFGALPQPLAKVI